MKTIVLITICILSLGASNALTGEVANGLNPKGKPMTLIFTEDLRVDDDGESDFECTGTDPSISADSSGWMYIADQGSNRILVFNEEGEYDRAIGRTGEGPGEFVRLYNFTVLNDGRGIALSGKFGIYSLHWFDKSLQFVKKTEPPRGTNVITGDFSDNGQWLAARVFKVVGKKKREFVHSTELFNKDLKSVKSVPAFTVPAWDGSRTADPTYVSERATDQMKGEHASRGLFAFDAAGNIYTANTGSYEINKWDPTFKEKLLTIKKQFKRKSRTPDEIKSYVEDYGEKVKANFPSNIQSLYTYARLRKGYDDAEIPPFHNPVYGLLPMPDGTLLVIHSVSADGKQTAEIFNKKGDYMGQVTMDNYAFLGTAYERRMTFRNGFAYTIETNEDDSHSLVRYSYKPAPAK